MKVFNLLTMNRFHTEITAKRLIYSKLIDKKGAIRELNPGPPVPKTGIIPLDQSPLVLSYRLI